MIPAPSYQYITTLLNQDWVKIGNNDAPGIPKKGNIVGFIFFDQNFKRPPLADFIENIDILNNESGKYIYFFLPGVSMYGSNEGESSKEMGKLNGVAIYHNSEAFVSFKSEFEDKIRNWKYTGGVDIVLIDVIESEGGRSLDFDSAIFFKVDEFINLHLVERTFELITKIIKFRKNNGISTARELKKEMEKVFGTNWVKALILSFFPKSLSDLARVNAVLAGGSAVQKIS